MIRTPKIGDVGELSFTVAAAHAIDFRDLGMPAVLSTPTLIWFLENSARQALLPLFEQGEACVGVHVDVQHLAATPLGHKVQCRARVIHVAGRFVTFQVEAHDERELIARGTHKRAIVDTVRFTKSLSDKQRSVTPLDNVGARPETLVLGQVSDGHQQRWIAPSPEL